MKRLSYLRLARWFLWGAVLLCGARGTLIAVSKVVETTPKEVEDSLWFSRGLVAVPLAKSLHENFSYGQVDRYTVIEQESSSCKIKSPDDFIALMYPVPVKFSSEFDPKYPTDLEFELVYEMNSRQIYLAQNSSLSKSVSILFRQEQDACKFYVYKD